jgi:periplasmic divalent cation tolerance protein
MSAIFVYITTPSLREAEQIAQAAVSERLAACANILPGMKSVHRWQGKVESAEETVLVLKTQAPLFPAVEKRVKELHSAETPCIVALPLAAGSAGFLRWVEEETKA